MEVVLIVNQPPMATAPKGVALEVRFGAGKRSMTSPLTKTMSVEQSEAELYGEGTVREPAEGGPGRRVGVRMKRRGGTSAELQEAGSRRSNVSRTETLDEVARQGKCRHSRAS